MATRAHVPKFVFALFYKQPLTRGGFVQIPGTQSTHYTTVQTRKIKYQDRNPHVIYQIKKVTDACPCGREFQISMIDILGICLVCRKEIEQEKETLFELSKIEMR